MIAGLSFLEHLTTSQDVHAIEYLDMAEAALETEETIDIARESGCCEETTQVHQKVGVLPHGPSGAKQKEMVRFAGPRSEKRTTKANWDWG